MSSAVAILGIDLGKNWFHVIGIDEVGRPVLRRKLNRSQLQGLAATAPRCVVAMESCPGSQFWGRRFAEHGHDARLIPAQFVKPYVKRMYAKTGCRNHVELTRAAMLSGLLGQKT